MPIAQTPAQKRAVEAILRKVQDYLDMRYEQVRRLNPKLESIWEDVCWQQMTSLHLSLSNDKSFGPVRCHVGETLLGDDLRKAGEFFIPTAQVNVLGEIVEEREADTARTAGILEIHDMRSMFRAIDPSLERLVTLVQTYIWWDLPDAADLARFDKKEAIIKAISRDGISPEAAAAYREPLGLVKDPTKEQVLEYEGKILQKTVGSFNFRRGGEPGYRIIVAREHAGADDPDTLIDMLHNQKNMLKALRKGKPLDSQLAEQFARGLNCEPAEVTPELAIETLEKAVNTNRRRLCDALTGKRTGTQYDYKNRQLGRLKEHLAKLNEEHSLGLSL